MARCHRNNEARNKRACMVARLLRGSTRFMRVSVDPVFLNIVVNVFFTLKNAEEAA